MGLGVPPPSATAREQCFSAAAKSSSRSAIRARASRAGTKPALASSAFWYWAAALSAAPFASWTSPMAR